MPTHSKYANPLPDKLEEAARKVYATHQRGDKNRGDQIEKILQAATNKRADQEMIVLRAQRLQLDGLPAKPSKRPVESSQPPARHNGAPGKVKTTPAASSQRKSGVKKPVAAKKEPTTPF